MLELKSAFEEELATRLGLDRVPSHEELVERARAAGIFDERGAKLLSQLLANLSALESRLLVRRGGGAIAGRVREAHVFSMAARVEALLGSARTPERVPR